MNDIKFDFNDISLIPAKLSNVFSRKEINVFDDKGNLPIFVSPMDTVVDENNYQQFLNLGFQVCIPRGVNLNNLNDDCYMSFGLDEIEKIVNELDILPKKVLIDVANGHSIRVLNIAKKIKESPQYLTTELMIGNIANPETFEEYCKINVDCCRCGIGAGHACTTSANAAIHYPLGSLISECNQIKKKHGYRTKIIADGGFKNFSDIIKGIGLGADSVMLGNIINKSIESCAENYIFENDSYIKIDKEDSLELFEKGVDIYKLFRGMSTKEVQKKWGKTELRTSEGIVKFNKVEYSINSWKNNFIDYLKSSMSYQGKLTLLEFIGKSDFIFITPNAFKRFDK